MKTKTATYIDLDIIDIEEEPIQQDKVMLTDSQSVEIFLTGSTTIQSRLFKMRKRFDSILQVNGSQRKGEIIGMCNSAVYLLSPSN